MQAEAYLFRNVLFTFDLPKVSRGADRHLQFSNLQDNLNILPADEKKRSDISLALQLQNIFSGEMCEEKRNLNLKILNTSNLCNQTMKFVANLKYLRADLRSEIFGSLLKSFGDELKMRLELSNAEVEWPSPNAQTRNHVSTAILRWEEDCGKPVYFGNTDKFPPQWAKYWNSSLQLKFSVRISIIVCGNLVLQGIQSIGSRMESICIDNGTDLVPKQLLEKRIATDVAIATPEGTKFACHKSFLIAQSVVFQTMLEEGRFKEGESHLIEIEDMTDNGVQALLAFLYYRGIDKPSKDPQITLELLRASQKYDISSLEKAMQSIIVQKPVDWFDISTIIQLFFYSKNVEGLPNVKFRSLEILKLKRPEIAASEEFKQLFEDVDDPNRVAARELSIALATL